MLLGAGAFVAHFAWMADTAAAVTPAVSPPSRGATRCGWRSTPGRAMPSGSYARTELTMRIGYLLMALAAVGLVFGALGRWWRRTVLFSAGLAAPWRWSVRNGRPRSFRFSSWALAPLSAVGLTWVAAQGRRPLVITCVLGAVAMMETIVSGSRPVDGLGRARLPRCADRCARRGGRSARPLVVVAEDTRIDSALVPWIAARAPRVLRAAQDGAAVARARDDGRLVVAGPGGPPASRARRACRSRRGSRSTSRRHSSSPKPTARSGAWPCARTAGASCPASSTPAGSASNCPDGSAGELQLVVGDALALAPAGRHAGGTAGAGASGGAPERAGRGGAPGRLLDRRQRAGSGARSWMRRVHVTAYPLRRSVLSLELGRRAPRVIARLIGYDEDARGRICAAPLGPVRFGRAGEERIALTDESVFGAGWYGREGRGGEAFRWADADAVVLLRSAVHADVTVTLEADAAVAEAADGDTRSPCASTVSTWGRE